MSTDRLSERVIALEETHEFAEPPEQVWRALTTPELRERWLPSEAGGTCVRIVHELTDVRLRRSEVRPANGNTAPFMRAA